MQVTAVQFVLLVLLSGVRSVDNASTECFSGMHALMCWLAGAILGDPATGLVVGGTIQLMSMGALAFGGASAPDYGMAGLVATTSTILAGTDDISVGLAVGIIVAMLYVQLDVMFKLYNSWVYGVIHKHAEAREYKKMLRSCFLSHLWLFLQGALPMAIVLIFGSTVIEAINSFMPAWFTEGLSIAAGILPVTGFAVLLTFMPVNRFFTFLIAGYVLAAYAGLSILPIALLGAVIAIEYFWAKAGSLGMDTADAQGADAAAEGAARAEGGAPGEVEGAATGGKSAKRARRGFFKPSDFKDFDEASLPQRLPDGSYAPVLTEDDLRICSHRMWLMDTVSFSYATQNAPTCMYASYYALRKIYGADEDGFHTAILNQLDCVFNTTPPVGGLLLGAGLAIEDTGHLDALEAENNLKVGLMGPLAGVGDVIVWVLPLTILGSIAGYMALEGNPVGILLWLAVWLAFLVWRLQNYVQGYKMGVSIITTMADKINVLTEAAAILGLMVVGSLIYSSVSITTPLAFTYGAVTLSLQEGVLDQIFPNLLAVLCALGVYKLIKKGVKLNHLIIAIIVISCVCAALGILAA